MSDTEHSEDEANLPSAAECQKAIDNFVQFTATDEALAQFYLQDHKWDVQNAVNAYFADTQTASGRNPAGSAASASDSDAAVVVSTKAPNKFSLVTWNIDGLCNKNLKLRYQHIAKIIEDNKYSIVFMQEVVSESLRYFDQTLENYSILSTEDQGEYFTAILVRTGYIYLDESPTTIRFETTQMGRSLMVVRAHIGKAKLVLMNTHLESTGDHSEERLKQLKFCFKYLADEDPSEVNVIFGGDLNLRDKELNALGGPPYAVQDLWSATGSRKECQYTWDMTRNTNLEFPGRFKPRARFDRLYFRGTNPVQIKPIHFGLVGIEKVPGTQSFPSDHWGLETVFEIPVNK